MFSLSYIISCQCVRSLLPSVSNKKTDFVDSQQELYIYNFTFIPIVIFKKFLDPMKYHVSLGGGEHSASTLEELG